MTDQTTTTSRTPAPTTSAPENHSKSDEVRDRARDAADTGKQEAGRVVDEAREQTSRLVAETGDRAREHADGQLERTAGMIDQFGTELDDMATHSSEPDGYAARLARDGAKTAHQLSQRLDSGGLDGVLDDVKRFARQRPGAFLAASFAVGIVLGRVTRNADFEQIKQDMSDHDDDTPSTAQVGTPATAQAGTPSMAHAGGTSTSTGISP